MFSGSPWILGISSSHNGAVCLLHGSKMVIAIQEERLLRQKRAEHPGASGSLSISYCLKHAGISAADLDAVVLCAANTTKKVQEDIFLNEQLQVGRNGTKVFTVPHHMGHAVALHALSGNPSEAILVIDGNGSPWDEMSPDEQQAILPGQIERWVRPDRTVPRENISLYYAQNGHIRAIEKHVASYEKQLSSDPGMQEFRSLGDMYGFVGRQIFGSFFEGPGKVMGLAPYGQPLIPIEEFYCIGQYGFEFQDAVRNRFKHGERWPSRQKEYQDLATSVQRALEESVLYLCDRLRSVYSEHLSYGGGVALNSVANERIVRKSGFKNVFIMPAAEDSGTAIGAAYYGLWQLSGYQTLSKQQRDSVGYAYKDDEIARAIESAIAIRSSRSMNIVGEATEALVKGKILGWFQDGSELGPRALGCRSILCDPRRGDMKDVLNRTVKFREGFRPFAPMILEEDVYDWFDVEPPLGSSPFMLRVLPFREDQAKKVPAVVHVDGTGRVQTVSKTSQPLLHQLLSRFKGETGIPILLNTSFNIAGEPIVETPDDALWCLVYSGMDCCVLGDRLVWKDSPESDAVLDWPLTIKGRLALTAQPSGIGFGLADYRLSEVEARVFSLHISRAEDLDEFAHRNPWLQLKATVATRWGHVVHGLPRGIAQILLLIDGHRTGRDVFKLLSSGVADHDPAYTIDRFRQHLGLLRRIGAISYVTSHIQAMVPLATQARSIGL